MNTNMYKSTTEAQTERLIENLPWMSRSVVSESVLRNFFHLFVFIRVHSRSVFIRVNLRSSAVKFCNSRLVVYASLGQLV
jgi:hypothetical protein